MQLPSTREVLVFTSCPKTTEIPEKLHVKLDISITETLVQLLDPAFELRLATEDEITMLILQSHDKYLNLTYDSLTSEVIEIGFW